MKAIILAAGNSTRYGKNKLLELFDGKTLLQHNLDFCVENEIYDVSITVSRKNTEILNGNILFHPIMDHVSHYNFWRLENKLKISFAFQDPEKYGPGAALLPWSNIGDDVVVLLGDNYLKGKLDKDLIKTCGAVASYKELPFDKMNSKRFAAIVPTEKPSAFIIKEKPHNINEGKFYIGYMMFSKDMMQYVVNLKPSIRNEYEITDLFNEAFYSKIVPVFDTWCDITYQEDKEKMTNIIRESQIRS